MSCSSRQRADESFWTLGRSDATSRDQRDVTVLLPPSSEARADQFHPAGGLADANPKVSLRVVRLDLAHGADGPHTRPREHCKERVLQRVQALPFVAVSDREGNWLEDARRYLEGRLPAARSGAFPRGFQCIR